MKRKYAQIQFIPKEITDSVNMSSHNFTLLLSLMVIIVASTAANRITTTTEYIPPIYDYVNKESLPNCIENEIYDEFVEKCDQICGQRPGQCVTLLDDPGCKCKEGFGRDENYKCVICPESSTMNGITTTTEYIPRTYDYVDNKPLPNCTENEIYDETGFKCNPNCANSTPQCIPSDRPRCVCKEGFSRDENYKCVICPESSTMNGITTTTEYIPRTYDYVDNKPLPNCTENEIYDETGFKCNPNCANSTPQCIPSDRPRCVCKEGFGRDENYKCVICPESSTMNGITTTTEYIPPIYDYVNKESLPNCIENDIYDETGRVCDQFCGSFRRHCNERLDDPGCKCKEGFGRDENYKCVICPESSTMNGITTTTEYIPRTYDYVNNKPLPNCTENEIYDETGFKCNPNCANSTPQCIPSDRPRCVCKEGFSRDGNHKCVICPNSSTMAGFIADEKIPENEPHRLCGENETTQRNGRECDATCENPLGLCTVLYHSECICKIGFHRRDGKCIKCPYFWL